MYIYMGGCQQIRVPFLGTLNIRWRIIIGIQKETIILTTTHIRSCHMKGNDETALEMKEVHVT